MERRSWILLSALIALVIHSRDGQAIQSDEFDVTGELKTLLQDLHEHGDISGDKLQRLQVVIDVLEELDVSTVCLCPPNKEDPTGKNKNGNADSRRHKRMLFLSDRRIVLPPGAALIITPSLALPLIRHPYPAFASNLTLSLPFTIYFDKLGWTDESNPFGRVPSFSTFGISSLLLGRRKKRSLSKHGGDRLTIYHVIEDILYNLGMDGHSCLLRAICEIHEIPMADHGLFGEIFELLLTPSNSGGDELADYIKAEEHGRQKGECWPYYRNCLLSLFNTKEHNLYSSDSNAHLATSTPNGVKNTIANQ